MRLLSGSHLFLDDDLTIKQQEERREERAKIMAARDDGKRLWLYNGKANLVCLGSHGELVQ